MNTANPYRCSSLILVALTLALLLSLPALAQDDGPRSYWNARSGTNVVSFQYMQLDISATGAVAFAPGKFIYPNSDVQGRIFIGTWAHHMTTFNRPAAIAVNVVGGSVSADMNTNVPPEMLPPGVMPGIAISQSSTGYADPNAQFVMNFFGTSPLKSTVDLLNYEPGWSMDAAILLAFPVGEYASDKVVNLGQHRWYGRLALPIRRHFGTFAPGYMGSLELVPSVWLFADNDDFLGGTLKNEPFWQIEAHLTQDFSPSFFGSLDLLYEKGFQSKIDGIEVGEEIELGNLGFALNYQVTENTVIRTGFSSNVFGDDNLQTSVIRLQFVYAWHAATENVKKLLQSH